jgi:hypothetical protein
MATLHFKVRKQEQSTLCVYWYKSTACGLHEQDQVVSLAEPESQVVAVNVSPAVLSQQSVL